MTKQSDKSSKTTAAKKKAAPRKRSTAKKPAAKKRTTTKAKSTVPKDVKALMDKVNKRKDAKSYNYKDEPIVYNIVPTGLPSADFLTHGGLKDYGFMIFGGSEAAGKTTAALQFTQPLAISKKKRIAYLDSEFTVDNAYLEALGVDPSIVDVYQAETLEAMCDILVQDLIPSEIYAAIIWDSPSNMYSIEEGKKDADQKTYATAALIMGRQMKRFNYLLNAHKTLMIGIYHVSANMDKKTPYDDQWIISGGKRKDHNSICTLFFQAASKDYGDANIYNYKQIHGRKVKVANLKHKYGHAFRTVSMFFEFGVGYSVVNDVYFLGVTFGIIEGKVKKMFGDVKLGNGQKNSIAFLKENPDIVNEIREKIMEYYEENGHIHTSDKNLTDFITKEDIDSVEKKKKPNRRNQDPVDAIDVKRGGKVEFDDEEQ